MDLINYTKKSIKSKKIVISYPKDIVECGMMDSMLKIIKTLNINLQIQIIGNNIETYDKKYQFGLTEEDLINIKNSEIYISFENDYSEKKIVYKTEDYLQYALEIKYNIIKCFNVSALLEETIFLDLFLNEHQDHLYRRHLFNKTLIILEKKNEYCFY